MKALLPIILFAALAAFTAGLRRHRGWRPRAARSSGNEPVQVAEPESPVFYSRGVFIQ